MNNNYINKDKDYKLYTIAELKYNKVFNQLDMSEKYPIDWYSNSNYKLKVQIIAEALSNHILIKDTDLYNKNFIESIKYK